jgi:hypothetical protein
MFVLAICASITLAMTYNSGLPVPPRAITEGAIAFLPALGLLLSYRKLVGRLVPPGSLIIASGMLVAVAFATILNGSGGASILGLLAPAIVAVTFSLSSGMLDQEDFRTLARWIIVMGLVQLAFAIAQAHLQIGWVQDIETPDGYVYRPNLLIESIGRASGTMGHPILLGLACAIAALLTLSRDVIRTPRIGWLVFTSLAYGVVLSGSRSSVAALLVGTLIYFLHPRTATRRGFRVLIVLVLIPTMFVYISEAVAGARVESLYSLTNRLDALPRFLKTLERPLPNVFFGEGEAFALSTVADNQFLTTTGAYGLLGLLVLFAAILYALFSKRPMVTAITAVLTFMALSFDVLEWTFTAILLWTLVGMSRGGKINAVPARATPDRRMDSDALQTTKRPLPTRR